MAMNDGFSSGNGDRGGVPNVMILVSDGDANINVADTGSSMHCFYYSSSEELIR